MTLAAPAADLPAGELIRYWRGTRRLSQMALAHEAEISPRHLSFIETGRANASPATIDRLSTVLALTLRQRNALMLAAGFAPQHPRRHWSDPELQSIQRSLSEIVHAHLPFPALIMDARGDVLLANRTLLALVGDGAPTDGTPANVYRLALLPGPFADRIENRDEWHATLTAELVEQAARTGDPQLAELAHQAVARQPRAAIAHDDTLPVVPLVLRHGDRMLRFTSIRTHLSAPREVLSSELALETFMPLDDETREVLAALNAG